MNFEITDIYIFDLDGVLVQPNGYRQALRDTILDWVSKMGIDMPIAPGETEIAYLESQGVTSEWDMIPFTLALIIERWMSVHPDVDLPEDFEAALRIMHSLDGNEEMQPDFMRAYHGFGMLRVTGKPLVEGLLEQRDNPWMVERFPRLRTHPLLDYLFSGTRDLRHHLPNRDFQVRVLGSEIFEQTFGISAPFMVSPYLSTRDIPLADPEALHALLSKEQNAAAIMTARPCRPPRPPLSSQVGYSPEAEIAVSLLGLEHVPLMGHGALMYVSEPWGIHAERLLKPSPFQALAAFMAALKGNVLNGLLWAYRVFGKSEVGINPLLEDLGAEGDHRIRLPERICLHVFEDSPVGVQACLGAAEILRSLGCQIIFQAWGIAHQPAKVEALKRLGAQVFEDVNQALEMALGQGNHKKRAPVLDSTDS
jgi:hypothetical protein